MVPRILFLTLTSCAAILAPYPAWPQSFNLTGLWQDETGKQYRIRQVEKQLFWDTDSRPQVVSVFHGQVRGSKITGEWADLPGGQLQTSGKLTLRIESNDRLVKTSEEGSYGATVWTRQAAESHATAADLSGTWRWSCCDGRFSGMWQMRQSPDGTFSGEFSGKTPEDTGTIQGRLQGNQVEFTRRGTYQGEGFEQKWVGTVDGDKLRGRLEHGEFSAERTSGGAPNLLCTWRWSCCGGQFSGTWQITTQNPDGTFSGEFSGKTALDTGAIQGRLQGKKFEFIRRGAYNGQAFEQKWTGVVEGNKLKGRLEHGEFSAECASGTTAAGDAATGTGGGICYDPQTLVFMDEWLNQAIPPQQPGNSLRYDSWGRLAGKTRTGPVDAPPPPKTHMTRCDWLWWYCGDLRSTNGLGTLREYVDRRRWQ